MVTTKIVRTRVIDQATNETLCDFEGALPLPLGAVVQLGAPNRNAVVVGVRVLAMEEAPDLILDVVVKEAGAKR